jgi:tetratricopeptide (TPR) repeat protein
MLALLVSLAPAPQQPALLTLRTAESLFAAGELTAAETAFRDANAQLPHNTYPRQRLAALYLRWNRPTDGLAVWETTPDGDPFLYLQLLAAAAKWDALEAATQEYLKRAPTDESAYALLTQALLYQSRCPEAASVAAAWEQHARTDAAGSNAAGSNAALTAAILRYTADPDTPEPAICVLDQDLCAATQTCTGAAQCLQQLGESLLRRQRPELAACTLAQAIARAPENAAAHAWLGVALEQIGSVDAALPHFRRATTLAPDSALGWLLLGLTQLNRQNIAEAYEALLRAQALDPGNPAPCLAMAGVLAARGDYANIPIWTVAALERAPEDPEIWKATARFYLARNLALEDEPLHAAAGAVQLAPEDAEAWMLLGWAQFNAKDFDAALTTLQTALTYDARHSEAHHLLGLTLQALGRHAEAQDALTRAQDLGYQW